VPVVVTGASGRIGRVLIPALVARGEVRPVVRDASSAESLRALGAKAAVASLEDTGLLATIMNGAHTVIHLAGSPDLPDETAYAAVNLGTTRDVLAAATEASVARVLFLSYPGASSGSPNAFLRAKGVAEEDVEAAGVDHLILRCTHVSGPGQRWYEDLRTSTARSLAVPVIGSGRQRVAPVHVRDVAAALVAADDRADPISGTLGLQGPSVSAMDEVVDVVAGRARRKLHLNPTSTGRASRLFGRAVSATYLELLAHDSLADARDAAEELGLTRTPFADGLAGAATSSV
jgi:nucleoside-diphosphate-sugar epimerase